MAAETEIQFELPAFLAAMLAGAQSRRKCPPGPQTVGGITLRVQQVEFTSNAIRHEGQRTQVAQEIVVHVAAESDVLGHPDGPPATVTRIPTCALIAVEYRPRGRQCEIGFDFDGIEKRPLPALPPGFDPQKVEEMIERKVEEAFRSVKQSVDFDAFLAKDATIVTAGVSVSNDQRLIAFRAELGPVTGSSAQSWKRFFDGFFPDRLGGEDWGMFLPREMIVETFVREIRKSAQKSGSKLFTIGQVSGRYAPAGDRARIDIDIEVRLHPPDPFETIVVHPSVGVDLAQGEPGFLTTDVFLPNIEVIVDAVHDAISTALVAFLGPAGIAIQALVDSALGDSSLAGDLGGMKNCWQVAPLHRRCKVRLPAAALGQTALRITGFAAKPEGVLLSGRLRIVPLTPSALDTSVRRWRWKLAETSCGPSDTSASAEGTVRVAAEVNLGHTGTTPVHICGVRVLDDPLGKFPRSRMSWDDSELPTTIVVEVPDPGPAYAANPYPVRLLVETTLGARVFELGQVTELDEAARMALTVEMVAKVNRCTILVIPGFNLKWLVDPPFIDVISHHRWEILLSGLQLGEKVKLFDSAGRLLVHAEARAGIATLLSALVAPAGVGELKFMRLLDGDLAPAGEIGMEIRQQQVLQASVLPFAGTCERIFDSALWSRHGAVAVLDDHLTAFDFADPRRPRRVGGWQIDGLIDALEWQGGLLAFSAGGFHSIDAEGSLRPLGPSEESAIVDVAAGAGVLYVLTENSLEVRSPELGTISSRSFEGGRCLLRHDRHLVVGTRFGVRVLHIDEKGEIGGDGDYAWPDFTVAKLEAAPLAGDGYGLALLANGTGRLFTLDEKGGVRELAEFASRPWFAGAAELETALLRLGPDSRSLQVGIPGRSHLVGAEAATIPARG
ncbi:MAG TPA: hypothetical protein VF125_07825 [Solirubrobacterales bacterium]